MVPSVARPRRASGFTLVELMLVIGIIGILATVAIPGFTGMVARARASERPVTERGILDALKFRVQSGERLPTAAGTGTELVATYNPPLPLSGAKKKWDTTVSGWKSVDYQPDGYVWYQYEAQAYLSSDLTFVEVRSTGDVDGDGVYSVHDHIEYLVGNEWTTMTDAYTCVPAGTTCN